jgi:hypothetical protein
MAVGKAEQDEQDANTEESAHEAQGAGLHLVGLPPSIAGFWHVPAPP